MRDSKRLHTKTFLFAGVAVLSNVLGNFALSQGMRQFGRMLSPASILSVMLNVWIAAGICLLAVWMLSQLSLLSWADLSYVLPITSALHEYVSPVHWAGIALIFLGVMIVSRTHPRTLAVKARAAEAGQ